MAEQRREDPETAAFHDDRVMRTRLERHAQIAAIGVEHDLPRSYSTVEECQAMGRAVFSGAHVVRSAPLAGTTAPGDLTSLAPSAGVYRFGSQDGLIDGTAEEIDAVDTPDDEGRGFPETSALAARPMRPTRKPKSPFHPGQARPPEKRRSPRPCWRARRI